MARADHGKKEEKEEKKEEKKEVVEVQSKGDEGWYAAELQVIEVKGRPQLKAVFYEYNNDEEIIRTWEEALRRVRFQSKLVQENECFDVLAGMTVVALHKLSNSAEAWFDASVLEAVYDYENPHVEGDCECRWRVLWLEGQAKGEESELTGGEICFIETKDISARPEVADFRDRWFRWEQGRKERRGGASSSHKRDQARLENVPPATATTFQSPPSSKAQASAAGPATVDVAGNRPEDASPELQPAAMRKKKHRAEEGGAAEIDRPMDGQEPPVRKQTMTARKTGVRAFNSNGSANVVGRVSVKGVTRGKEAARFVASAAPKQAATPRAASNQGMAEEPDAGGPMKRPRLEDDAQRVNGAQGGSSSSAAAGAKSMETNGEEGLGRGGAAVPEQETREDTQQVLQLKAPPAAVPAEGVTGVRIVPRTVAKRGGKASHVGRPAQVRQEGVRAEKDAAAVLGADPHGGVRDPAAGASSTGAAASPSDAPGQASAGPADLSVGATGAAWVGDTSGGQHGSAVPVDGNVKVRAKTTARRGRGRGAGGVPRPPVAPPVEFASSAAATGNGTRGDGTGAAAALGGEATSCQAGAKASRVVLLLNVEPTTTSQHIYETIKEATGEAVEEVVLDRCAAQDGLRSAPQDGLRNGPPASGAGPAPASSPVLVFCTSPAQASRIEKHINTVSAIVSPRNSRPWMVQVLPSDTALSVYLVCRLYNRQPLSSLASSQWDMDSFKGAPGSESEAGQGAVGVRDSVGMTSHGFEIVPWGSEASHGFKKTQVAHMRQLQGLESFLQRTS